MNLFRNYLIVSNIFLHFNIPLTFQRISFLNFSLVLRILLYTFIVKAPALINIIMINSKKSIPFGMPSEKKLFCHVYILHQSSKIPDRNICYHTESSNVYTRHLYVPFLLFYPIGRVHINIFIFHPSL